MIGHEISMEGLDLIKKSESCRLMPYQDAVGVWTDGWGNTHSVQPGVPITQEEADERLIMNLGVACSDVNHMVAVEITQAQFDALVSFVYNVGAHALKESTLLLLLNHRDFTGAAAEFQRWNHANGKVLTGLTVRRAREQELFRRDL